MTTVSDIVTRAFRKIGVASDDESLTANQIAAGVEALNMMLNAWKLRGVNLGLFSLASADDFPLPASYEEGTVYLLASRLSPDYMVPAGFDSDDWFRTLQADTFFVEESEVPKSLKFMPSSYWRRRRVR